MDTASPTKVALTIPCRACGQHQVTLALLTSYGSYCRCEACGHDWHEERTFAGEDSTR